MPAAKNLTSLMLCCVTVRSVWRVVRLAVAFRMASLSGALFSCFFCWDSNKRHRRSTSVTIPRKVVREKKKKKKNTGRIQNAFSLFKTESVTDSANLFFWPDIHHLWKGWRRSFLYEQQHVYQRQMTHWQLTEQSLFDIRNKKADRKCFTYLCLWDFHPQPF